MPSYSTLVEFELKRAQLMTRKDRMQRWVTMDGKIHSTPVPYRDAISVRMQGQLVCVNYRDRAVISPAIGCTL